MIAFTFATHSTTLDNERGIATGWLPGTLSHTGRTQARALGTRYRGAVDVVFSSDLARALETASIAFDGSHIPRLVDWRLRECNYGDLNGHPSDEIQATRLSHLDVRYPGGEGYVDVVLRVASFLRDLVPRWDGARVLVIGHSATRYALDHLLTGVDLSTTIADPGPWRAAWAYELGGAWPS